jgi:hypothetical protein
LGKRNPDSDKLVGPADHGLSHQHCSEKHLHRYVAEFDFRYSNRVARGVNDGARTERALRGIVGKRLTYRWPD